MKKLSIILIIMIIAATTVSAALPQEVITIRAVGAYRKMTSSAKGAESVDTLLGAGMAFDYDYYINNYVGLFTNIGLTVPLKNEIDGVALDFEDRDFPVYAQFGMVGRIPVTENAGLDLRLGFGVTYDRAASYSSSTVIETSSAYYIIYNNYSLTKIECQILAGLGAYMNIDSDGSFGMRVGAVGAATVYTGIYREGWSRYSSEVADLKRVGFEIQPYVGFTIGFTEQN